MKNQLKWALLSAAAVQSAALLLTSSASADLVAYYPLDGNVNDVVGGFNGTTFGSPTYVTSPHGQAIDLSGSGQYATLTSGTNFGLGGNFTVSAFINSDALTGDHTILGNDGGSNNNTLHLVTREAKAHMGFFGNDQPGNASLSTGTWTNVIYQFKDGVQSIYLNGALDASGGGHAAFAGGANTVNLGRWNSSNYFDGRIDQVSIFNSALPAAQIGYLASGGDPRTMPASITWDFRGGLTNGWNAIHGATFYRDTNGDGGGIVAYGTENNVAGFAHDAAHETLVYRSPAFKFNGNAYDGTNVLSVDFAGGMGHQEGGGPAFDSPDAVIAFNGGQSAPNGEKAVAVLDTTTGKYVAYLYNPGDNASGFTNLSLTQFNALNLNLNHAFQLDFYENDQGGWGWTQLRQVSFAGAAVPEPATASLLALAGLGALRRSRRR